MVRLALKVRLVPLDPLGLLGLLVQPVLLVRHRPWLVLLVRLAFRVFKACLGLLAHRAFRAFKVPLGLLALRAFRVMSVQPAPRVFREPKV